MDHTTNKFIEEWKFYRFGMEWQQEIKINEAVRLEVRDVSVKSKA